MLKPTNIIENVKKFCKDYFPNRGFSFKPVGYFYKLEGNSKAINHYNNVLSEINVLKWFNDYWVYISIEFKPIEEKKKQINNFEIFVSLSIFQGDEEDDIKNQLFRAEWDNYTVQDEQHPQPHWHIFPVQYHHKSFADFLEFAPEKQGFMEEVLSQKKVIDIKKIHFAMNGQWATKGTSIHSITNDDTIANWLSGALEHLKEQLIYIS